MLALYNLSFHKDHQKSKLRVNTLGFVVLKSVTVTQFSCGSTQLAINNMLTHEHGYVLV